jgi:hypothetical protein
MDARKTAYIDGIRAKQSHAFRIDLLMGLLMCLLAVLYSGVTMFTGFIGMFPSGLMIGRFVMRCSMMVMFSGSLMALRSVHVVLRGWMFNWHCVSPFVR